MAKMAHASRVLHGSCTEVMVVLLPPDCLAQNVSLQVQQHNSNHSFLTAVVIALCVARRQPTNKIETSNPVFQFLLQESKFSRLFPCLRPYNWENASSRPITEVKLGRRGDQIFKVGERLDKSKSVRLHTFIHNKVN